MEAEKLKDNIYESLKPTIKAFPIAAKWITESSGVRLDASHFNPALATALAVLKRSGLKIKPLGEMIDRVFIPTRFKRIYVDKEHGVPFLQGSHIVHFQPADLKYLSLRAQRTLQSCLIEKHWILVTRSGTVGRVAIVQEDWHGWAASEHLLRVVPKKTGLPPGYIYAFLSSPIGQVQLVSSIYGAVVDEITEDHVRRVMIPTPESEEEIRKIVSINEVALRAIQTKETAVHLAESSITMAQDLLIPPV